MAGLVRVRAAPLKTYTNADGLAHNSVHRIVRDSPFLWLSTFEGLSRFDGYGFTITAWSTGCRGPSKTTCSKPARANIG